MLWLIHTIELCKATAQALNTLIEQEAVADVLAMYQEFFTGANVQDSVNQHSAVSFQFGALIQAWT